MYGRECGLQCLMLTTPSMLARPRRPHRQKVCICPNQRGGVCSLSEPSMGSSMAALGLRQPSKWDIIVGLLLAKPKAEQTMTFV